MKFQKWLVSIFWKYAAQNFCVQYEHLWLPFYLIATLHRNLAICTKLTKIDKTNVKQNEGCLFLSKCEENSNIPIQMWGKFKHTCGCPPIRPSLSAPSGLGEVALGLHEVGDRPRWGWGHCDRSSRRLGGCRATPPRSHQAKVVEATIVVWWLAILFLRRSSAKWRWREGGESVPTPRGLTWSTSHASEWQMYGSYPKGVLVLVWAYSSVVFSGFRMN